MRTLTNLLIASSLVLVMPACKQEGQRPEDTSGKPVDDQVSDQAKGVGEKAGEKKDEAQDKSADKADEFKAKAKKRMEALDRRIEAIKTDAKADSAKLRGASKEKWAELMSDLDAQRAKAKEAYDDAASASKDRWHEARKKTGQALDDLEKSTDSAVQELEKAGIKVRDEVSSRTQ